MKLRRIRALDLPHAPAARSHELGQKPKLLWVKPTDLLVDDYLESATKQRVRALLTIDQTAA